MTFKLTNEQNQKIAKWAAEQDRKVANLQGRFVPNYGASGGSISYIFTPTGLGLSIIVRNAITGDELDLTEYGEW